MRLRPSEPRRSATPTSTSGRAAAWLEAALIFVVFFVHGGWPAPDVNESHYLPKARAFWDADWLAGDFFLDSADAHVVFYATCGWLAAVLPFSAAAWCGRVLTWVLLAWAWRRLSFALIPRRWYAVLTAALFVTLLEYGNAGGEWVIGGFEAKGLAFVLVFLGLEQIVRDRWNRGLLCLGAASAFHVLVGGWTVIAAGFSWLLQGERRRPLASLWPGLVGGLLLALPGLWPALKLSLGADAATVDAASRIQVFIRLNHHLDPYSIVEEAPLRVARHALVVGAAPALLAMTWHVPACRRLGGVVAGGAIIAAMSFALAYGLPKNPALAARLLRFYWLRASDFLAPLAVSLLGCYVIMEIWSRRQAAATAMLAGCLTIAGAHLGWLTFERWQRQSEGQIPRADLPLVAEDGSDEDDRRRAARRYADWLAICRQIRERTRPEAVFITPRHAQSFHWHAQRREVAAWKDVPQDAAAIVAWFDRMRRLARLHEDGAAVLLATRYWADYILTDAAAPLPKSKNLQLVSRNSSFLLYRVRLP